MAKSRTTNVAYYFARRKDTGMAGVWFTHCANNDQRLFIVQRLIKKAGPKAFVQADNMDTRFYVSFLEEHFTETVRQFCKYHRVSIALDLQMQVLREVGHDIVQMP